MTSFLLQTNHRHTEMFLYRYLSHSTKQRLVNCRFSRMVQDACFPSVRRMSYVEEGKTGKHKAVSPSMGFTALVS